MLVLAAIPVLLLDLSVSDGGLMPSGQTGQWGWGDPMAGPVGEGNAWGTNLDDRYLHDTVDVLEVPLPPLIGTTRPVVVLRHWYDVEAGDAGRVEVNPGTGWVKLAPLVGYPNPSGFTGLSNGWVEDVWDLTGLGPTPRFRLNFTADAAMAADGWYLQEVSLYDGDVLPPQIGPDTLPVDTQDLDGPYEVIMQVTDDVTVLSASLSWSGNGGPTITLPMVSLGSDLYRAEIPGQSPDTSVRWWVEADDGAQIGRWPPSGEEVFRVFLAAPTGLSGPTGSHLVATRVDLTWEPPVSPHAVLAYHLYQDGVADPLVVTVPEGGVNLSPTDAQQFEVRAVYDVGSGDLSPSLALDVEVPQILPLDPAWAFQGEQVYIQFSGESLYLLQGTSTLDLGPDIRVLDFDVRDANAATALIEVDVGAPLGDLDMAVVGTQGRFSFADAFSILDGADAPRIRRITPVSLKQGEEVDIEVEATVPFEGPLSLDPGEDLVVTGRVEMEGTKAWFGLAASTRSRIGRHTLVIDDGARLFAVDVQVDEYVVPPQTSCATGNGGGPWWLVLLGLARRRRPTGSCSPRNRSGKPTV